jgi:hypothetical protein
MERWNRLFIISALLHAPIARQARSGALRQQGKYQH